MDKLGKIAGEKFLDKMRYFKSNRTKMDYIDAKNLFEDMEDEMGVYSEEFKKPKFVYYFMRTITDKIRE